MISELSGLAGFNQCGENLIIEKGASIKKNGKSVVWGPVVFGFF